MDVYYLIIPVGWGSWHGLAGSFGSASLHKASKVSTRAVVSSEGSTRGESVSKLIHMAVGRKLHFLTSYWLKASVPCHMGLSVVFFSVLMTWHLASCRLSGPREGAKRKPQYLYVPISDGTHYQFHCILFFESKSLG